MPVPDYVMFHDGVVERITMSADQLDIELARLCVYKEEGPKKFGVWAAKAVLRATGIHSLAIIGAVAREHDRISSGEVMSRTGIELVDIDELKSIEEGTITLLFTQSAARLHCRAKSVSLTIVDPGKRFESFTDE